MLPRRDMLFFFSFNNLNKFINDIVHKKLCLKPTIWLSRFQQQFLSDEEGSEIDSV